MAFPGLLDIMDFVPGTISQNKHFIPCIAFGYVIYNSNKSIINAEVEGLKR